MRRFSLAVLLFGALCTGSLFAEDSKSLIRLSGLSKAELTQILSADYDVARIGKAFVEIVVTAAEKKNLEKPGRQVLTLIPDMDAYIAKRMQEQSAAASYYTYDTMTAKLNEWAKTYANIARLSSAGKSWEGRDVWAMKVSDNPDVNEKEPAVLIMGAHHAREWISVEVPMEVLKEYLEGYGKDARLTNLVNEREVWFIPMVNPDGITFSQTKTRYWRKNRRDNDGRNFGVDLNRNYGYHWGLTGASNSFTSDTYHGPKAFSEPETTAIKDLAEKEKFQASISFHSYSELVLFPFGYDYNVPCEDTPTLNKLATEMSQFNKYTPENSAELYPAMGDSDDYMYGVNKALAFTIELAREFIPPADQIAGINNLNVPAVFHCIDKAAAYAVNTPSGDPAIAQNLDLNAAIDSLEVANELEQQYSPDSRIKIDANLQLAEKRVAELTADDLLRGETASWNRLNNLKQGDAIRDSIRNRLMFSLVHGQLVPVNILAKIQKLR